MKKLSNEENIDNLQKRKFFRILAIVFGFLTIAFALLNLIHIEKWWYLMFSLISAFLSTVLLKARENIPINRVDGHVDEAKISEIKEKKKLKERKPKKKKEKK